MASREFLDKRIEDIEQRERRSCEELPHTVMRRNRGNRSEFGSGGFHSANENEQIFCQPSWVTRLDVLEDAGRLGVGNDDVKVAASCLMRRCQLLIVVNGRSDPEAAHQN